MSLCSSSNKAPYTWLCIIFTLFLLGNVFASAQLVSVNAPVDGSLEHDSSLSYDDDSGSVLLPPALRRSDNNNEEAPSSLSDPLRSDFTEHPTWMGDDSICKDKFIPILRDLITNEFNLNNDEIQVENLNIAHLDTQSCGVTQQHDGKLSILKVMGIQVRAQADVKYSFGEKDKKPIMKDKFTINVNIPSATVSGYVILVENTNADEPIDRDTVLSPENTEALATHYGIADHVDTHKAHYIALDDDQHYIAFVATEVHELTASASNSVWAWMYNSILTAANGPLRIGLSMVANNYISKVLEDKWNELSDIARSLTELALESTRRRDAHLTENHAELSSSDDKSNLFEENSNLHPVALQPAIPSEDYASMSATEAGV